MSLRRRAGSAQIEVVGRTGPRRWGGEQNLYLGSVEDRLGFFENRVAVVYRKLLEAEPLTSHERLLAKVAGSCVELHARRRFFEAGGLDEDVLSHFPEFSDDFPLAKTQAETIYAAVA